MERNHYLSNAVREEVKIYLCQIIEQHYQQAVDFLQLCLERWQKTTSVDGRIKAPVQTYQSPCKIIQVEYRPTVISISFYGVPMIRENRWDNLIQATADALIFPNAYFKVNNHIVTTLVSSLPSIPRSVVYKAVLEICQPFMIDEVTFKVLQSTQIPTQDEIESDPTLILVDEYYYERKPIPIPQPQPQLVMPQIVQQPIIPQPIRVTYIPVVQSVKSLDEEDLEILERI